MDMLVNSKKSLNNGYMFTFVERIRLNINDIKLKIKYSGAAKNSKQYKTFS